MTPEKIAAAIKVAHSSAAAAADSSLRAIEESSKATLAAQSAEALARQAMTACDDAVALLAQYVATRPNPEPQPTPVPTPVPTPAPAPVTPPTPAPGPVTPAQVDALHYANFKRWYGISTAEYGHAEPPGMLAYRYAYLPAVPAGWLARHEGKIIADPALFAGNFNVYSNWKQTTDAKVPQFNDAHFGAAFRDAIAANGGRTSAP